MDVPVTVPAARFTPDPGQGQPELGVTRLGPEDADAYAALRLEALRSERGAFGAAWDQEAAMPSQWFADRLARHAVFGGWQDSRLCGLVQVSLPEARYNQHKATLGGMYVHPCARRSGLARQLLHAALDWSRGSVEEVMLGVVATNAAGLRLYAGAGFACYGLEPRAIKADGRYHDVLLMRLVFAGQSASQ